MGKTYTELNDALRDFIAAQRIFFVATAPLAAEGRVNLSPKGLDCFRILGPRLVGYADYTGSGVETIAHVRENGRLTIMFCAFDGRPNIVRLYGRGRVVEPADAQFNTLVETFAPAAPLRSIILLDVEQVMDSCGFGVPLFNYVAERDQLTAWARTKGVEGVRAYQAEKNTRSLDGLPGLTHSK